MIIIKIGTIYKIISDQEISYYLDDNNCKVIGKLNGDYPSLRCSRVSERSFKNINEISDLLKNKIIIKQKIIIGYEKQLNNFVDDLKSMGVK